MPPATAGCVYAAIIIYRESSPYLLTAEARLAGDFGSNGLSLTGRALPAREHEYILFARGI
jgi:hypothetical protein